MDAVGRCGGEKDQLEGAMANKIGFIVRATCDVLPSPKDLHQRYGRDPTCALGPTPATLSLTQGRCTWWHNRVLKRPAAVLENRRSATSSLPPGTTNPLKTTTLVRGGQKNSETSFRPRLKREPRHGTWLEDADGHRPAANLSTRDCPHQPQARHGPLVPFAYILELTVQRESAIEEAYEREKLRYASEAARLVHQRLSSGSGMQRICGVIHHQDCYRDSDATVRLCGKQ